MKVTFWSFLFLTIPFFSYGQNKTVYGDLRAKDSIELNVIKVAPDSFPAVSVIFEAIKNNQPVFGLSGDVLTVTENSKPCKIIKINEIGENFPINISLIIDHSGSMMEDYWQLYDSITKESLIKWNFQNGKFVEVYPDGYVAPIDNAKKAVLEFIKEINSEKDSIQIVGFSTRVDIYSSFSTNKEYLQSVVDRIKSDSSTAFLDAINFSLDSIINHSGIKVIIALTDGLDNSSHITVKELIHKAKNLKIPIYTIGLGNVDKKFLSEISKSTGGAFYYTKNSNSLASIYKEIQERIHSIYDLEYISENLNPDDSLRQVKLEFKVDSLYLSNNISEFRLSEKVIKYLNDKVNKERYQIQGWGISAMVISSGIIVFYYRRRKKSVKA